MAQYGFYVDLNACIGCKACQMACKDRANNEVGFNWRRVIEYGGGEWTKVGNAWQPNIFAYFVPTACHHCSNPPCLPVCPTAAISKDENGIVKINVDQCIGCHYCEWACLWGAPIFYEDRGVVTSATSARTSSMRAVHRPVSRPARCERWNGGILRNSRLAILRRCSRWRLWRSRRTSAPMPCTRHTSRLACLPGLF
ncbi:MAG: hypothetical protein HPY64_02195 [Anaerolineae bacterium]|nr:hypothetical protein [Anaerolineae bacterium]